MERSDAFINSEGEMISPPEGVYSYLTERFRLRGPDPFLFVVNEFGWVLISHEEQPVISINPGAVGDNALIATCRFLVKSDKPPTLRSYSNRWYRGGFPDGQSAALALMDLVYAQRAMNHDPRDLEDVG